MYKVDKINKEHKRVNAIRKAINILIYIIIIPIIVVNFTMIFESFITPNETPNIFGFKMFTIISGSMEPTINTGDLIVVKEAEQNQINKNDIISFKDSGAVTTHRIVDITDDNGIKKYTTKGDNNNTEDKEKTIYENIEGKYLFKVDGIGFIIDTLKSPITLMVLAIIIAINYWNRRRLYDKKQERKYIRKMYKEKRDENK